MTLVSSSDGPSPRARPVRRARRPTATSSFGVSRREGHDASAFYARFEAPELCTDEDVRPVSARDQIWTADARRMDEGGDIADGSVALVVTSPPYFAGKDYEQALGEGHVPASYGQYLEMLEDVFAECVRKLEPGGRIAINVANLGRKPYRSLAADVTWMLQDRLKLLLRGEIVWWKAHAAGGSCAWGTYQRPGNPVLRDLTERVVVASKGRFDRALSAAERLRRERPNEGSMSMDDFVDATTDVWDIPSESATRVGHPAPFPVELPRRLIELYTYRGDLVLDPFMGSGSTAVAAIRTERSYVGFDTDPSYVARAEERAAAERSRLETETGRRRVVVEPRRRLGASPAGDLDPLDRARREGRKAKDLLLLMLEGAGFADIELDPPFPELGVEVGYRARDRNGDSWLFDLSGALSSTRPGLRRADNLWRALAKAFALDRARSAAPGRDDLGPLVLVTTDLPQGGTPGAKALSLAVDPDRGPVTAVIELLDPEAASDIARIAARGTIQP